MLSDDLIIFWMNCVRNLEMDLHVNGHLIYNRDSITGKWITNGAETKAFITQRVQNEFHAN